MGVAGNNLRHSNYGVYGCLTGDASGVGVYGSVNGISSVTGQYAGYFNGTTCVEGTLTATEVVTPSDLRLKENITSLAEDESKSGSTLGNVLAMNVLKYNYKMKEPTEEDVQLTKDLLGEDVLKKAVGSKAQKQKAEKIHFGVSAQELQTIYPNLVEEGQDGYLAVNYVELVPILIRSIQELKEELDEMKGNGTVRKAPSKQPTSVEKEGFITENVLYQNTPNQFKESTEIRFSLADDARDAAICIFDMQGKLLKKMPVSTGMGSLTVNGFELGEGMFLYSLIVNGQEIDTKRMILTK
jgi:hypothetical protein